MTVGTDASGLSQGDPLSTARTRARELAESVQQIEAAYGNTLGVRRLRSDMHRLFECLDELGPPLPGHHAPAPIARVRVPGEPYDESMWGDAESEGLGGLGRFAR